MILNVLSKPPNFDTEIILDFDPTSCKMFQNLPCKVLDLRTHSTRNSVNKRFYIFANTHMHLSSRLLPAPFSRNCLYPVFLI